MAEEKYEQVDLFNFDKPVIKGYPELRWTGKRPYTSTQFYPAQLKEKYGEADETGWINKIFWGDNLQVMSHLLKEYRGKVDLIYIDPPFDSKADYKKKIEVKGKSTISDSSVFEEKQYGDIWTNDEYLQFMYERLILLRELLSDQGTIYLHCDWHKAHQLRCLMDEVFGLTNFINEVVWCYEDIGSRAVDYFKRKHDTILMYGKTDTHRFNIIRKRLSESTIKRYQPYFDKNGHITYLSLKESNPGVFKKLKGIPENLNEVWLDIENGAPLSDWWTDISPLKSGFNEALNYPTQKPETLIERIIKASSNEGNLVFDCFMGSGTTQAVAMKLGRRFIGADINLGAVQTTSKRLLKIIKESENGGIFAQKATGFEVYNVNNYDFFRNPLEAKDLLVEALGIQKFAASSVFDGELDGRHVKILPVNRIATKADLGELVANLPYKLYEKFKDENPNDPVDRITLVCMGHEPDLGPALKQMVGNFKIDVEVVDILKDKKELEFKRDSQAEIVLKHNEVIIKAFYPMNLLQKLSLQKENVDEWRQLVDSIMVDYDYNGETLNPQIIDVPEKNELVKGKYGIPANYGRIKVKITDLLSESLEIEVE